MAEARSGGFTVGNGYRCDLDSIPGWTMLNWTANNYPVFDITQGVFTKDGVYTCLEKRLGYRQMFHEVGEEVMFCRMNNGWWVAEFNASAFTTVIGN